MDMDIEMQSPLPEWLVEQWAWEERVRDADWPARPVARRPVTVEDLLGMSAGWLDDAARIDHLVALEAVKSRVDAAQVRLLAALDTADTSAERFVVDDVSIALRMTRITAETRVTQARTIVASLPATLAAVEAGVITLSHATAVCAGAARLPVSEHARLEQLVLPRAATQTRTETVRSVNRAVLRVDPAGAERRHNRARADRSVTKHPEPDGMASLVFRGAATDVATVYARLDAAAHRLPAGASGTGGVGAGGTGTADPRTLAQRRADLFVDALLAGLPVGAVPTRAGRAPSAEVVVSLSTLLGFDDEPGDLAGYGPIPAGMARAMATDTDSTWRRIVTDPVTGALLDYGRTTYRPPAGLRHFITARDPVCAAPGCLVPARACDLDHIHPFDDGGPTAPHNLAPVCGRHHDAKTKRHLSYRRDPDGTYTWVTHTGHNYRTQTPHRWTHTRPPNGPPHSADQQR